jgi:hypothetical protein
MGKTKERHQRLRVTQNKGRSGQLFYGVGLELERNEAKTRTSESVDGGAYGVEVRAGARRGRPDTNTEAYEIAGEETHNVIQCDAFFDGPEGLT